MGRNCIFTLLGFALCVVFFGATSALGRRLFKDEEDKQQRTPYIVEIEGKLFVDP